MIPEPTLDLWLRSFAILSIEAGTVVLATWVLARTIRSTQLQRTLWQVSFCSLLAVLVLEVSGGSHWLAGWFFRDRSPDGNTPSIAAAQLLPASSVPVPDRAFPPERIAEEPSPRPAPGVTPDMASSPPTGPSDPRPGSGTLSDRNGPGGVAESSALVERSEPQLKSGSLSAPVPDSSSLGPGAVLWWPAWVWFSGSAALLFWIGFSRCLGVVLSRAYRPVSDPGLVAQGERLVRQLGIRRKVRLVSAAGVRTPCASGILRPTVVVPPGFLTEFNPVQQQVMLAHELAHLKARDPLWQTVAACVVALYWWHPLAWTARVQFRKVAETAADDASLLVADGPAVLAECLVTLGTRLAGRRPAGFIGIHQSGFRSALGKRVERLISLRNERWNPLRATRVHLIRWAGSAFVVSTVIISTAWISILASTEGERMKTRQSTWRSSLAAVTLIGALGLNAHSEPIAANPVAAPSESTDALPAPGSIDWQPWSAEAVRAAQREGRAVLVNFGAAWCLTCKANKAAVLESPAVRATIATLNVVALEGDYTQPVPEIEAELKRFDRRGVPLTLVYAGRLGTGPSVLPEVLTPKVVLTALNDAADPESELPTAPTPRRDEPAPTTSSGAALGSNQSSKSDGPRSAYQMDPELAKRYGLTVDPSRADRYGLEPSQTSPAAPSAGESTARYGVRQSAPPASARYGGYGENPYRDSSTTATYRDGRPTGRSPARGQELVKAKLEQIVLEEVFFDSLPLNEVLKYLAEEARRRDREDRGVNFLLSKSTGHLLASFDPITGAPLAPPEPSPLGDVTIRFNLPLRNVRLIDTLDAITKVSERPIQYSIEDYGVVFSSANGLQAGSPVPSSYDPFQFAAAAVPQPSNLEVRTFHIDPERFYEGANRTFGIGINSGPASKVQNDLRQFLSLIGVELTPHKTIFYNDLTGTLMVRATPDDLQIVQAAVETLGGNAGGTSSMFGGRNGYGSYGRAGGSSGNSSDYHSSGLHFPGLATSELGRSGHSRTANSDSASTSTSEKATAESDSGGAARADFASKPSTSDVFLPSHPSDHLATEPAADDPASSRAIAIIGEVNNPRILKVPAGRRWTLVDAVAAAGGFTSQANQRAIELNRAGKSSKHSFDTLKTTPPEEALILKPGDLIVVGKQFF